MGNEVVGSYQPALVVLSYLVAVAASFSALDLTRRFHELRRDARTLLGADDFVRKPLEPTSFGVRVQAVLLRAGG